MRRSILGRALLFVLVAGMAFLGGAGAGEHGTRILRASDSRIFLAALPTHQLQIAYEASSFDYEEPAVMREQGGLEGFALSYAWSPGGRSDSPSRPVLRFALVERSGTVDYTGQLTDGTDYRIAGIKDRLFEFRVLIGLMRQIDPSFCMIAYAGYGRRSLRDDASFDPAGYERVSRYDYLPLGVELIRALGANLRIGAELEYDALITGKQTSRLSELDPSLPDVENEQKSGSGAGGWLWLQVGTGGIAMTIGPWVRYWSLDTSLPSESSGPFSSRVEPRNHSWEVGGRVGVVVSIR
ncbi:MAG: hypothetical protein KAY32_06115 [Candidatus Eisenbacteria sp.]|nr:hypothetical protein [Candidatus Eisenbacteria bacterium]